MTATQLRKALHNSRRVYGWVSMFTDDGAYLQVTKKSVQFALQELPRDAEVNVRWDGFGTDLYIN